MGLQFNSSKTGGGRVLNSFKNLEAFNIAQNNLRTDFLGISLTTSNDYWSHLLSRDLLRLFTAQKSIWQYGTTFHYFLEVAVIVIVMRLVGT